MCTCPAESNPYPIDDGQGEYSWPMNGLFGLFLLAQCSLIKHPAGVSVQGWRRRRGRGGGVSVSFTVRLARTHLGPPHISHGKTNKTRAEIDGTRFLCTECVNFRFGLLLNIPCTRLGECIFVHRSSSALYRLSSTQILLDHHWVTLSVCVWGGGGVYQCPFLVAVELEPMSLTLQCGHFTATLS